MSVGGTPGNERDRSDEIVERLVHLEERLDQIEARFDKRFRTFAEKATTERDRIYRRLDEVIGVLKTVDRLAAVAHWRGRRSAAAQPAGEVVAEPYVTAPGGSACGDVVELRRRPVSTPAAAGPFRRRCMRNTAVVVTVMLVITIAAVAVRGEETGQPAEAAITHLPSILHPVEAPDAVAAPDNPAAPPRVMATASQPRAHHRPAPPAAASSPSPSPTPLASARPRLAKHCFTVHVRQRDMRICL